LPTPLDEWDSVTSSSIAYSNRDRKKLNSGVRVRGIIKFTELGKFKLAIFQQKKELGKFKLAIFSKKQELAKFKLAFFFEIQSQQS
jgi:hypothetical protein